MPLRHWPFDAKFRIIPPHTSLGFRLVGTRAFVLEVRKLADNEKPVRTALRDPDLTVTLCIKPIAVPQTKGRGRHTQVNNHVKYRAACHPYEFILREWSYLVVQATQHITAGSAVVILDKLTVYSDVGKDAAIPRFKEKAAAITVHYRPERPCSVNLCGYFLHD